VPTSVRENVLANFFTALQQVPVQLPGTKVLRNYDVEVQEFPAVVLFDGGHVKLPDVSGVDRHDPLRLDVECYVIAATHDGLAAQIDGLYTTVLAAVLADPKRGGLAVDTRETEMSDPVIERVEGQGATAGFVLSFEIEFWTRTNDPTIQAP
jgi:hypothetical protein